MHTGGGRRKSRFYVAPARERETPRDVKDAPAFASADQFVDSLQDFDPAGGVAQRASIARLVPGEAAMALEILTLAIELASKPTDERQRRDARGWLLGSFECIYSARVCLEALGGNYDAIRKTLMHRWAMQDAIDATLAGKSFGAA